MASERLYHTLLAKVASKVSSVGTMKQLVSVAVGMLFVGLSACSEVPPNPEIPSAQELTTSSQTSNRLVARFFGVTTILLTDGDTTIMTDGFFSRPALLQTTTGKIAPNGKQIQDAFAAGKVNTLAALFVAHSHYDHALDSAQVAKRTGARLMGSESTANLGRAAGLPNSRIGVIYGGETYDFGKFRVTAFQSPHSPDGLYDGGITAPLYPPARASDYREGGNFSFLIRHGSRNMLIHASANFLPGLFQDVQAEIVFLSIGTLGKQSDKFIEDYWREVVLATGAKLVIPTHWDNFFLPLSDGLKPMPRPLDNFPAALRAIQGLAKRDGIEIAFMPLFKPVDINAALAR